MRYFSIDLENARVVHAHPDRLAVHALATIELAHVACMITPLEHAEDFSGFTDMELTSMLKGLAGEWHGLPNRQRLMEALAAAVAEVPSRDVDVQELLTASSYVQATDKAGERRFRYVKGSHKPQEMAELWEPAPLHSRSGPEALAAAGKALHATTAAPKAAQATQAPPPAAKPASGRTAAPSAKPPAGGSVTAQIFAACSAVYQRLNAAAGNPAELSAAARKALLAEARLAAIPELIAAGVNANSARKGSSMWVQAQS